MDSCATAWYEKVITLNERDQINVKEKYAQVTERCKTRVKLLFHLSCSLDVGISPAPRQGVPICRLPDPDIDLFVHDIVLLELHA
jgi:hypothetical protein